MDLAGYDVTKQASRGDIPATDVTESSLHLREQDLSKAADPDTLNLNDGADGRGVQMQKSEAVQRRRWSPRRTTSAPASLDHGPIRGDSDFLDTTESAVEANTGHQHPVLHEHRDGLFSDQYNEGLEDGDGDDSGEEDLDEYLVDIGSRPRASWSGTKSFARWRP